MDDFRARLDDEARRVSAELNALDRVRERARRRRISRQVGVGVTALAIAGTGFAVALGAFPAEPPRTLPTGSAAPSVTPEHPVEGARRVPVGVAAYKQHEAAAQALTEKPAAAGYSTRPVFIQQGQVRPPPRTRIFFRPGVDGARREARGIRTDLLPGAMVVMGHECFAFACPPPVEIWLGADFHELINQTVRVRVLDAGGGVSETEAAAGMLEEAGYDVVEVGKAPAVYDNTIVACAPSHEQEGFRILRNFFPEAHFTGEIPAEDHDVSVYIGPDYTSRAGAGN